MATVQTARAVSKEMLKPNIAKVCFEMVDPPQIQYQAGQYIILHTAEQNGKIVKRSYSIASAPDPKEFSLCVKVVGTASRFIADLNPGDQVRFSGPWGLGKFTFPEHTESEIVMLAGGTGISPVFSLLAGRLPVHPEKKFLFLWGLKKEEDVFYQRELEDLRRKHAHFEYRVVLSEPDASWQGPRGLLSAAFVNEVGKFEGKEYFLAGNGNMINIMEVVLKSKGVAPEKIHKEIFFLPA